MWMKKAVNKRKYLIHNTVKEKFKNEIVINISAEIEQQITELKR